MAKKKKGGEEAFPKRTDWTSVKKPQKGAAAFRRLTPGEREKIKQFITENPEGIFGDKKEGDYDKKEGVYKKEVSLLDGGDMVIDVLRKSSPDEPITGEAVGGQPLEMDVILDFTGLRGSGSNIYHALIYQVPKWTYSVMKADESLLVSPVYADLYNLVIGQKQKIEASIKTGLTSAAQAVADYELLAHDARRYGEILDYFKEGKTDEHVLRSLFVDRVDAFTGEGYSLITMAKRWPTIITDFIRMGSPDFKGEEWTDVKDIHAKLDVSMAEATVLKTKDRIFKEWKATFFPAVKERFARIQSLLQARRRSVEEYRNWLKPYIAKYRTMKEADEANPAAWVTDAYTTPGFGQSEAMVTTRLWMWKIFRVWESGKPSYYKEPKQKGWVLYPYDDFVRRWKRRIEYKYNVKIEDKDVEALLKYATTRQLSQEFPLMTNDFMYYIFFDFNVLLSLLRTPPPEGMETDNLMIFPLRTFYISQNILLLNLLELRAKESALIHYIDELIGASSIESDILAHVEEEFEPAKKEKAGALNTLARAGSRVRAALTGKILYEVSTDGKKTYVSSPNTFVMRFAHLFVRPGPYESVFYERVSKMYSRAIGQYYGQMTGYIKDKMHVGQ